MTPNPQNRTVDKLLQELDELYEKYWVNYKKHEEPYDELLSELEIKNRKSLLLL